MILIFNTTFIISLSIFNKQDIKNVDRKVKLHFDEHWIFSHYSRGMVLLFCFNSKTNNCIDILNLHIMFNLSFSILDKICKIF